MFVVWRDLPLTWGAVIVWIESVASDLIASDCTRFASHGHAWFRPLDTAGIPFRNRTRRHGPLAGSGQASLPVLRGWFEGEEVFYITTDVSHADVAEAKGANFAPRLADALPAGPSVPGRRSSVDKVYAVTNFKQESIFASAPYPMGSASRDTAYSPLWQMVKVTWTAGKAPQTSKSEEAVLAAVDSGAPTISQRPTGCRHTSCRHRPR